MARAQSTLSQVIASALVGNYVEQLKDKIPVDKYLGILEQIADLLKGSIHVEDVYMKVQIVRIAVLVS